MNSITEGMRNRKRIIDYAIKHNNNAKAARKYHVTRQFVSYWRKRYDGTIESLRKKSTRPKSHPNQHTEEEFELIKHMYRYHKHKGLAHVYRKCTDEGYTRTYDSMCKQINKLNLNKVEEKKTKRKKKKKKQNKYTYPGQLVEIDIKYVPLECIGFVSNYSRYYQITAIDVYSRKRVLDIVNENSTYTTSKFLMKLEQKMGFEIEAIQTDNGREFCNDKEQTDKKSLFEKAVENLGMKYKRTAPYSPWQNGHVERSHREDEEMLYQKKRFSSEKEMVKSIKRHNSIGNNIYRKVLNFKSANEMVDEYFRKSA